MSQQKYLKTLPFSHIPILHPAIYWDDASGLYAWAKSGTGADYTGSYSTSYSYVGTKCIYMATKTTTPAADDYMQIARKVCLHPAKLLRLQFVASEVAGSSDLHLLVTLDWHDGANDNKAELLIDYGAKTVSYLNSAGTYTLISGFTFSYSANFWNYVDFSVDFNNNSYGRIALNNQVVDLSDIDVYQSVSAGDPSLVLMFRITAQADALARLGMDQMLLTPEAF